MKPTTLQKRKYWLGTAIVLLAAGVFATEASFAASEAIKPAQEIRLHIGTLKIAALSNLYAADKLGYFKNEGLKVTFTQMGGGAQLLPAVSAGKIDIALSIPSNGIQGRDKGFDFKMVMQNEVSAKAGKDSQAMFVNSDSGISSMAGLKGKTIAVNYIGNQMWLSAVEVLRKDSIDKKDVNFIELPFPNMEDSLVNKQIDAAFNVEPFTSKMLRNPKLKVISYAAVEALPGQPVGAFWASERWLRTHQVAVEKFVKAMRKTNDYLREHPLETQKIIAEYTGLKLETIQQMRPILWDSVVDKPTWQRLLDLMKNHGLISANMKVDDVIFPTALQ
ncbi:MAG: ABC transporter substrate-binding protein [Burkholderiaceae bacterium]|nr:MAG: ABC transporter substrate-binding protein [Burkholderiaceae bacterium]